jgi:hypothetical protein
MTNRDVDRSRLGVDTTQHSVTALQMGLLAADSSLLTDKLCDAAPTREAP